MKIWGVAIYLAIGILMAGLVYDTDLQWLSRGSIPHLLDDLLD